MNKLTLSITLTLFSVYSYAQNSFFEIKKTGTQYTFQEITNSFASGNFCGSFFLNKRNKLVFNDGSEIELKSKMELEALGIFLTDDCFLADDQMFYQSSWSIAENGMIMKGSNTELYGSEKEYLRYKIEGQ